MSKIDVATLVRSYSERGVAVAAGSVVGNQVSLLKQQLYRHIAEGYESNQDIVAFDKVNGSHDRNLLFLDSGSSAYVFHEPIALQWNARGTLEEYEEAVARVGHGLHVVRGAVRDWLQASDLGDLSRATGRSRPAVIESMFVRKSRWSEELPPHIDHTYLWTNPPSVQVFWVALDACNAENGGLMVDVRGPLEGSPTRLIRTGDEASVIGVPEFQDSPLKGTTLDDLKIIECLPGDGVLVDGLVVHGSSTCKDGRPRDALAIHIIDLASKWSDRNYLGRAVPLEL